MPPHIFSRSEARGERITLTLSRVIFSLTGIRKLKEEGCEFRSHIDGSKHFFTPENVMDTERIIGADIMMAFDECPPGQSDYQYAKNSLMLTQRWLDRCIKRFNETEPLYGYQQSLFPIVQGCTFPELRREAAKYIADKPAPPGYLRRNARRTDRLAAQHRLLPAALERPATTSSPGPRPEREGMAKLTRRL